MPVKRGKPQGQRVDIHKPSELRLWAKYWDCTKQDVRDAVYISGVMVKDVQDWIERNVVR